MSDMWLVQGVMPLLGGVVFLGLARRPPWTKGQDATGSRRGSRALQLTFAVVGLLWLLGGTLYLVNQFARGS
ncbi:MAG TPA: hypothetical protein VKG45_13455 [Actinomycetes bacterium]|nr:hypothetical protein [Actinomycetes bacterium]